MEEYFFFLFEDERSETDLPASPWIRAYSVARAAEFCIQIGPRKPGRGWNSFTMTSVGPSSEGPARVGVA